MFIPKYSWEGTPWPDKTLRLHCFLSKNVMIYEKGCSIVHCILLQCCTTYCYHFTIVFWTSLECIMLQMQQIIILGLNSWQYNITFSLINMVIQYMQWSVHAYQTVITINRPEVKFEVLKWYIKCILQYN